MEYSEAFGVSLAYEAQSLVTFNLTAATITIKDDNDCKSEFMFSTNNNHRIVNTCHWSAVPEVLIPNNQFLGLKTMLVVC